MYKKILVPLDGSDVSEKVLPLVCELAEASKAELILLRIVEYPHSLYPPYYEYPPSDPDILRTIAEKKQAVSYETSAYLERIISAIGETGPKVTAEVCDGPVVESILDCINRRRVDLVILSTHGQGGGTQEMIGAVANRLLHESQVPVILVRPTIPDKTRASSGAQAGSRMDLAQSNRLRHFDRTASVTDHRRSDIDSDQLPRGA
jgi:nucleotide-binding universal stress UspA family protein